MAEEKFSIKAKCEGIILTIYLKGKINKDTVSDFEKGIFSAIASHPKTLPKLDAEGLQDISCEGLRALKKIRDTLGLRLKIANVSKEIYDIFDSVGFTDIFNIKKVLRTISIEGKECIGSGITCKVYKLDEDKIIKVYEPQVLYDFLIEKENDASKAAFLAGVQTPIVYDIVKVGDRFGNIFEYCDGEDLLKVIEKDREHLEDYIKSFAQAVKKAHKIQLNPTKTDSIKQNSLDTLPLLVGEGKLLNQDEYEKLKKVFDIIPDSNSFSQGDCHPGNARYKNGVITLLDLATCGRGHPIFDMGSMYIMSLVADDPEKKKITQGLKDFTCEEIKKIYDVFLKEYLGTDDPKLLEKANNQIKGVEMTRILFSEVAMPGTIAKPTLEYFKGLALAYANSGLEPPCF